MICQSCCCLKVSPARSAHNSGMHVSAITVFHNSQTHIAACSAQSGPIPAVLCSFHLPCCAYEAAWQLLPVTDCAGSCVSAAPCRKKALAEAELHEPCCHSPQCGLLLQAEQPVGCKATALTRRVYSSADQTLEAQHPALACNTKRQNGFSHALLLLPLPSYLSKLHERSRRAVANLRV
jgi:hypothetical protein